jgi:hypothetical protein
MSYFLIHNSDGDTTVREVDPKEVAENLAAGDYYGPDTEFLSEIPKNNDTNYWGENTYLLIKGEIVTPKPKTMTVVETYEIP